jgi:hypothetical protein
VVLHVVCATAKGRGTGYWALPDYTAWEADAGRRLALLTVCAVGAIAVGLMIATIIIALH